MKKLHLLLIVALISAFTISCSKDEEEETPTVDNRSEWVGHYVGESNGSISINFNGDSQTQPIEADMEFDIKLGDASNEIIMTDESGETVTGTVDGNKVTFEEMTESQTQDGVEMTLYNNMTGTFSSTNATIIMNISGTATYLGIEMPVTGTVTTVADKQ